MAALTTMHLKHTKHARHAKQTDPTRPTEARTSRRRLGVRVVTIAVAASLAIGALAAVVAVAPEVYSPKMAAASNVYTTTVNGTTGSCASGWYSASGLNVPAGVISTKVTLIGGGGGGSVASGTNATGGVGGGAAQVVATIPATALPGGSVLWSQLGCGGGAGATTPTGGAGGVGANASGAANGGAGGTAQGDNAGGGGGGGTALCVASTSANCTGSAIIGVAGGGGGAAGAVAQGTTPPSVTGATGGQGGSTNGDGSAGSVTGCTAASGSGTCTGGGGGTASSAGAGGTGLSTAAGSAGSGGSGGAAAAAGSDSTGLQNAAGGGGGGGYFGGGGGAAGQDASGTSSASGSGGGAASSYWDTTYGGSATFSNVTATGANCGALTTQCVSSSTNNGGGGTAGNTGASGSLVVQFTVGAVAANSSFGTEPSASAASGAVVATQPAVTLGDYTGATVSGDPVKLAIASQPAGPAASLTCTSNPVTSDASGVASFAGCAISGPVGSYTLSGTDTANGVVVATSSTITLTPGTATQLAFTQQPSATVAGATMTPAVTVAVEDAAGNVETGDNTTTVSLAIGTNPGGGTLSGGSAVAVSAGVASFSGLSINKAGTGYTLVASSTPTLTQATSNTFDISPGAANRLAFVQGPTNTVAGKAITPAVTVAVEDSNGNVETGDNTTTVSLALGTNPGGGTLSGGGAVTVSGGVATFSGLSINKVGTGYTLSASSSPAYTAATSSAFNVTVGAPTQLAFIAQPSSAAAGSAITPSVTVAVEDANGNVETGDNSTQIGLIIGTNPGGGTLSGGAAVTVSGGVATFSGLSINKVGLGYTLIATSSPAYTGATSSPFSITPGPAKKLTFLQQPSNTPAGAAIIPAVTVAVEDAYGNIETADNTTTVSLAIGTNPGSGTLSGGGAVTVSSGIATFGALAINNAANGYTLVASSSPTYTVATSSTFNIVGAAAQLAFVQGPSTTTAGSTMTPAVTVAVEDANGNVETTNNSTTVSLAIANNPGNGTLTGGGAVTVVSGIATFSGLSIDKAGTGYTLTATSSPSYTLATSGAFTINPGAPTQLAFVQQPSDTAAGAAITPAVTVAVEDAYGNVETGDNTTTVALGFGANPGGATLSGGGAVAVSGGIATFSGLSVNKVGTGYTLSANSSPAYAAATSSAFSVTPGAPTHLAFVQGPSATTAGATMSPAVTVAVEDANGNVESGDNTTTVSLAIANNPSGGTLTGGGAVTVASGVATFSGLSIDKAGVGYTLTASSTPTYTAATSAAFTVNPGAATQLAFVQQPTDTAAGASITPAVTVAVEDANGNVESGDNTTTVSLALGANPGSGTLSGGSAVTVSAGVATFPNLSIDLVAAGYTLVASSTPTYTAATSATFTITPGLATHLAFVQQPSTSVAGTSMTPAVTVAVEDAYGNIETSDSTTTVSLAIGTNPGGGTLSGGSAVTVSGGIATFSSLSIDKVGTGYTLVASSTPAYGTATSAAFDITVGPATQLAFVQQPTTTGAGLAISPAVTVAVEDAHGNVETGDNSTTITMYLGSNPTGASLNGGGAVTVSAGVATFSNLSLNTVGTGYTLLAASTPSYSSAGSSSFNITAGTPTKLVFGQQPTTTVAGSSMTPPVTVKVEDAFGNVELSDNTTTVSLALGTNTAGGTLSGGGAVTVASGVATFSGLSVDKVGTGYTLVASSTPTLTTATSSAFAITPGAATQLAFVQQPTTVLAGADIGPAVTVAVEDANGNVVTSDNATTVSLAIGTNPAGGTLSGGAAVTVTSGIATFGALSIDNAGNGYTLVASSSPTYTTATSSAFNVVGPATQLVFVQGPPASVTAGAAMNPAVTVAVEDANGNVETTDSSTTVSLALGTNTAGGTLSGGGAVTVASGVATFSGLSVDTVGTGYTLVASSTPTLTTASSSAFAVTPGAATQLAFVQQPTTTVAGATMSPAVTVAVEDAYGNLETSDTTTTVNLSFGANPGGGTLSGGAAVTVSGGIATFSGLSVDKAGTGYTLKARSTPAYTVATSSYFDITPGAPTQLVFVQGPPTSAQAGVAMTPAVTVAVEDAFGNVESGDNTTTVGLALGTNTAGGTLSGGAAVPVGAGIATFPSLSVNKVGTGYTLVASSTPAYTTATSSAFAITPGAATQLVFVQQPSSTTAGASITPAVTVAVEDANGNVESGDNTTTVGLALGTNTTGATLSGGAAVTVNAGVATFSVLSVNKTGSGYTLVASSTPAYAAATSFAFNVSAGTATQLVFVQQPTTTEANTSITPAVTVAVEDANGNVETTDSSTSVSLALAGNPTGATLSGGAAVTDSAGIATFSGLSINLAGTGYSLVPSSTPTYATATSVAFDITAGQITLSQSSGLPTVSLGTSLCAGGTTPGVTLDGRPQYTCGSLAPLTVTNTTGLTTGWTVSGQVSDFLDPGVPATTCDTTGTYNNHCIPGGDMGWGPTAQVDSTVTGTSAQVQPGSPIAPSPIAPPGSVVSPPAGLNATPQVLCQAPAGLAQGRFTCGASLALPLPASAAAPSAPGYEATLTLTLF